MSSTRNLHTYHSGTFSTGNEKPENKQQSNSDDNEQVFCQDPRQSSCSIERANNLRDLCSNGNCLDYLVSWALVFRFFFFSCCQRNKLTTKQQQANLRHQQSILDFLRLPRSLQATTASNTIPTGSPTPAICIGAKNSVSTGTRIYFQVSKTTGCWLFLECWVRLALSTLSFVLEFLSTSAENLPTRAASAHLLVVRSFYGVEDWSCAQLVNLCSGRCCCTGQPLGANRVVIVFYYLYLVIRWPLQSKPVAGRHLLEQQWLTLVQLLELRPRPTKGPLWRRHSECWGLFPLLLSMFYTNPVSCSSHVKNQVNNKGPQTLVHLWKSVFWCSASHQIRKH